ncbi:MAG TPA: DUF5947 family protein [Polyangiaceae bacterium]|jgi:hypothetical protein
MTVRAQEHLRRFVAARSAAPVERCELCGLAIAEKHEHVLEPAARGLRCACSACGLLFSERGDGRFLRVRPRAESLLEFSPSEAAWQELGVPVGLVFFVRKRSAPGVVAALPGRAGTVESLVSAEAWESLCLSYPRLRLLDAEVEALLVRRTAHGRAALVVSIDHCYELSARLMREPAPLSMVEPAAVDRFFAELDTRAGVRHGQACDEARAP